jgi:hypothetical protein
MAYDKDTSNPCIEEVKFKVIISRQVDLLIMKTNTSISPY